MTLIIEVSCTTSRQSKRFILEPGKSVEIGRSRDDLHVANDPRLSRRHFRVAYNDGEIEITHLSRTNPTLVASDGSKDFRKVTDTQTETGGCRIIAGSHRFVLMVEKAESILEQTFSEGGEGGDFWSDVEDGFQGGPTHDEESASVHRSSPTLRDQPAPPKSAPPRRKTGIFDDDEVAPREKQPQETIKESKPKVKKLFFPVADDFFDD